MTAPDTDVIADNLMAIQPLLYKGIYKPLRAVTSITPAGLFVMGSLKRHGVLSMSEIGKCLTMPKPHITVIVDKLIEEGFVERQNDPKDRRIVNIALTENGAKGFEEIKKCAVETLKTKLALLSEEQRQQLSESTQQLREILVSIITEV